MVNAVSLAFESCDFSCNCRLLKAKTFEILEYVSYSYMQVSVIHTRIKWCQVKKKSILMPHIYVVDHIPLEKCIYNLAKECWWVFRNLICLCPADVQFMSNSFWQLKKDVSVMISYVVGCSLYNHLFLYHCSFNSLLIGRRMAWKICLGPNGFVAAIFWGREPLMLHISRWNEDCLAFDDDVNDLILGSPSLMSVNPMELPSGSIWN